MSCQSFLTNLPLLLSESSREGSSIADHLVQALDLIDVKVLDHIIVDKDCFSFAE